MNKEQAKSKIRMSVTVNKDNIKSLEKADDIIDQIFNDHEAQLKAKDEEIEVLYSHLKTIDEDYSALASDFESAVVEIDRLKDTK